MIVAYSIDPNNIHPDETDPNGIEPDYYFFAPFTPSNVCTLLALEGFDPHHDKCLVSTEQHTVKIYRTV